MPQDLTPLQNQANTVRQETGFKKNTAIRIGDLFLALISALGTIELTPGDEGMSAYEVAVQNGFAGDQAAWLASLIGDAGQSAYEVAVSGGFVGDQAAWLASLVGDAGQSAYEVAVSAGFVGDQAAWLASLVGDAGQSAYEVAVAGGFVGDQASWLASLVGAAGAPAIMTRTSSTELTMGTGTKTFTYANTANLGWAFGMRLRATSGANYMEGTVDSVSSTVVTLIVDLVEGSGTFSSWTIGIAGEKGSRDIPDANSDYFELDVNGKIIPKFATPNVGESLPATGAQIAAYVSANISSPTIVASSGVVLFDTTPRSYQNQNFSSLEVSGIVPVRRLIFQKFGILEYTSATTITHSGFAWIIEGVDYQQDIDATGQTVTGTPASNPRIDILTGNNVGELTYTVGTEDLSPIAPAIPSGQRLVATITRTTGGENTIEYAFEIDPRISITTPSEAIDPGKLNIIEVVPTLFDKYAMTNRVVDIPIDPDYVERFGAIAWMLFNEKVNIDEIEDFSDNGINAEIINNSNATIVTDVTYGDVLRLGQGSPQAYAQIPNNLALQNLTHEVTVVMLMKTITGSSRTFFHCYDGSVGFRLDAASTNRLQWKIGPSIQANTSTGVITADTWMWVACRVSDHESDPALMRINIFLQDIGGDFVSAGTATGTKADLGNLNPFYVASNATPTVREDIHVAYLGVFPSSLTTEEIGQVVTNSGRLAS